MAFYLEISENAKKQIRRLPSDVEKRVLSKLSELKDNPRIGKPLIRSKKFGTMLWEVRLFSPGLRIYYTIHEGVIIIENIDYAGKVRIHCMGDKRSQRRDIDGLC